MMRPQNSSGRTSRASGTAVLLAIVAAMCAPAVTATAPDPAVATIIGQLGIEEHSRPARENPRWRAPQKLVVLGRLAPAQREALESAAPGVKVVVAPDVPSMAAEARDADIIMGLTTHPGICEPEIVDTAKELRWILSMSAGVERCMAIESVKRRDLLVTNMRGVESAAIAEHTIALMLALARRIDRFVLNAQRGRWSREDALAARMQTLAGKTLLVVGLGGIGTEVARRAHGIGMNVVATRGSGRTAPDFVSYVGPPSEMLTLARSADVIVNAAPLTTETTGIFNARFFEALKPTALFINVARGGSVVTEDLVAALTQGRIAGAGLDVVDPEPLPQDHPLWRAPNLILSPHVSTASDTPTQNRWILALENLRRYAAGEKMLSVVDLKREY
jgi:phosphoglycerate dehydrogenase-like enzyme